MAKKAIDRFSILYSSFKLYVMLTHRLFYRKMQAKHQHNIPRGRPVLLAPNHQNALMDAMAPLMTSRRDPVFLTRADVFSNPFLMRFFRLLKMLPVYRMRDGAGELSKNEEIFRESHGALLRKKSPVVIMAEGNHGDKRRLRPLVKGIFRVAFQAQENYGHDPGVVIVPVGIDYTNYAAFRSHMFIQYGEPLEVNEYYAQFEENQPKAINAIRNSLSAEMKKYIINIESEENYDVYLILRRVYNKRMRERLVFRKKDLYHRFLADQEMISALSIREEADPEKMSQLSELCKKYDEGVERIGMRDWLFMRDRYSLLLLMLALIGMLASLPVFLYGFITNYFMYWFINRITDKMIKDNQFKSSVKFVAGTFLLPVYYLILFGIFWIFAGAGWLKLAFLASMPIAGILAHTWFIWSKKLRSLWRYQGRTMAGNPELMDLKVLRKQIIELTDSMIPDPAGRNTQLS